MGLAALVSAGLLATGLSAVSPRWELALRTEARYRQVEVSANEGGRFGELELRPTVGLELLAPDWGLTAAYRPRLALADRTVDRTLVHDASLAMRWSLAPWALTSSLTGSYGRSNIFQLLESGNQAGQSQSLPWVRSLLAESFQAQLLAAGRPAPRYRLEAAVAAYLDGGADSEARVVLPLQRGLRARTLLEWQATHLGTLTSSLSGTAAKFSSGPDVAFAVWDEGWRQRLTRELEVWLAVGASATQQRRDGKATVTALPSGEAGAGYQFGIEDHQVRARLAATLAPAVDRVSGEASQRLGGTATYQVDLGRVWVVAGEASGGLVVRGPQKRDRAWGGSFSVGRLLGDHLQVDVGLRGFEVRPVAGTRAFEWVAFVALTATGKGKLHSLGLP